MKQPYHDDGVDIPLALSKADAFAMLKQLLQDKENVRFVLTPHDFYIQASPHHTALFTQLVQGLYPDTKPEHLLVQHDTKRNTTAAELRDPALIDTLGLFVGAVAVEKQSPTEGRQRARELQLNHKVKLHVSTLLVSPDHGPRSR